VFIGDILNSGAVPALEATLRFAGERQKLIAHNIANLTTPNFIQTDVSPATFERTLAAAIDRRRETTGGMQGPLEIDGGRDLEIGSDGSLALRPRDTSGNILFHDRNNRDLERLMQDQSENAGVYKITAELLRSRYQMIREAIAERV
jgi:flagellar basal-body rod protein FlgB